MLGILERLGVKTRVQNDGIYLATQGWKNPAGPVEVSRSISSQFASSILLNAWNLDFPLELKWPETAVSAGYFEISQNYALKLGMKTLPKENGLEILPSAQPSPGILEAEMDYSSAFAVAALAVVAGRAEILNADENSSQPDSVFEKVLAQMGVEILRNQKKLSIAAPQRLLPVNVNLSQSPDLFPVLAILCAFAEGESELSGAPHLIHKESDRIAMSAKLLELCGRRVQRTSEGMKIFGVSPGKLKLGPFEFDPGEDHRMVMAAAVARWAGLPIRVLNSHVVSKSFPEFVAIAGLEHSA
jgi:3-phosphoshikimate 1-carboxyvinyltransferase